MAQHDKEDFARNRLQCRDYLDSRQRDWDLSDWQDLSRDFGIKLDRRIEDLLAGVESDLRLVLVELMLLPEIRRGAASLQRKLGLKAADVEDLGGGQLAALALLRAIKEDFDQMEYDLIQGARSSGVTWDRLASALGVGGRAAAERRARRLKDRTRTRSRRSVGAKRETTPLPQFLERLGVMNEHAAEASNASE